MYQSGTKIYSAVKRRLPMIQSESEEDSCGW